jgi:hypothetical protein
MIIEHDVLSFDVKQDYFRSISVDETNIAKFLKGVYRNNKPRFKQRFVNFYKRSFVAYDIEYFNHIIENIEMVWDKVEPFTYEEAFNISDDVFRALVFSSIDVSEMISNLGSERIKVEGKELINKIWNPIKEEYDEVPYTVIYELHHANGEKLGLDEESKLPVIKCWCTTTNNEHHLWVDNKFSDSDSSPLDAITSTCVIYKSMLGKIKHIIRQGDVFLFEMSEKVIPNENEELVTLTTDDYFSLLKSQA